MPAPEMFGPASLALSQSVSAFQSFLPPLREVRKASLETDPSLVADVRVGEIAAATLAIGIGAIASSITGSPVPVIVSTVVAIVLISLYETTLRADRPLEPKRLEVS